LFLLRLFALVRLLLRILLLRLRFVVTLAFFISLVTMRIGGLLLSRIGIRSLSEQVLQLLHVAASRFLLGKLMDARGVTL